MRPNYFKYTLHFKNQKPKPQTKNKQTIKSIILMFLIYGFEICFLRFGL